MKIIQQSKADRTSIWRYEPNSIVPEAVLPIQGFNVSSYTFDRVSEQLSMSSQFIGLRAHFPSPFGFTLDSLRSEYLQSQRVYAK